MERDLYGLCPALAASSRLSILTSISVSIDMMQKNLVFCQLSRYICSRSIQCIFQNIHTGNFSNGDGVICYFVSRNKDIFTVLLHVGDCL